MYRYSGNQIAIVSMGGVYPEAPNLDAFWKNIISKKVSIKQLPDELFKSNIHYMPECIKQTEKQDKSYTRIGCHTDLEFFLNIVRKYRIPPAVSEHMDKGQFAILYSVDQAVEKLRNKNLPREKTAIILGNTMVCKAQEDSLRRVFFREFEFEILNNLDLRSRFSSNELAKIIKKMSGSLLNGIVSITEDTAPGQIPNIVAGRVANILDFWGPVFTVDAACASGLAAAMCGIDGLVSGEYDAVITGAVDLQVGAFGLVLFSAINALSPDGSFPFDARANGFVIGSGAGVVILKRLEDALRDKDNIMAVISGRARGSDGKGKSIAAPNEEGQIRVIVDAIGKTGYPVDTIEMVEAHGTGTSVGDVVEVNALKKAFKHLGVTKKEYCNLGSVKSNIGHLKSAAGTAGMIKAVLSLYNKTLSPTAGVENLNPKLELKGSPFYVATEKMPWYENSVHPRRANVSSFGFGGADYHLALEEYRNEFVPKSFPSVNLKKTIDDENKPEEPDNSAENSNVLFLSGDSVQELESNIHKLMKMIDDEGFNRAIFINNSNTSINKKFRAAFVGREKEGIAAKWNDFIKNNFDANLSPISGVRLNEIYFSYKKPVKPGNIAVMFPGQGSQYPNMLKEVYEHYPASKMVYDVADAYWNDRFGHKVTSLIFGEDEKKADEELKKTNNTHPAMFVSSLALFRVFETLGLKAGYMIGHSLGEITALCAAGGINLKDGLKLVGDRGYSFLQVDEKKAGILMSVSGDQSRVQQLIKESGEDIYVCNINSNNQVVVGGLSEDIEKFRKFLKTKGVAAVVLKVSHAFHSPLVKKAADNFAENIKGLNFEALGAQVLANHLTRPYAADDLENMSYLLEEQLLNPVRFAESIIKLYERGVRLFVETGPGSVLSNLVRDILKDKEDIEIVTADLKNKNSLDTLNNALAELFTLGVPLQTFLPEGKARESCSGGAVKISSANAQTINAAICYSGVSIGLPGSYKDAFRDDNFEQIFEGRNMIERLTESERKNMLELNITRLVKSEAGATFQKLTQLNEVVQLAGKIGRIDMLSSYKMSEEMLLQMTKNQCMAVAAGYEALADAGIPLVEESNQSSGRKLEERLLLPEEMREKTGVIFASGFAYIEAFIQEVSKYIAYKYASKTRSELIEFYQAIISRVEDANAKKMLSDWFALNYSVLSDKSGVSDVYNFSSTFIMQFSSLANSRMAQLLGAEGPNFQINAACSTTAYAITLAESLIKTGAAERMIILGSDNATDAQSLPYIAAGFLSAGAATTKSDLYEAALPFDARRNGLILSAGALGLILEKESHVRERGMNGICRLMGTHSFNMAGHPSRLDSNKYSRELEIFTRRMEEQYSINREDIARRTAFFSHETYTPREGGCSQTEKESLEQVFGEKYRDIIVCNTKGLTGHAMSASLEDAVAAKALQYQTLPPVANHRVEDPMLAGLNLSKGGKHEFDYALRMVAGFGGQGNYSLLKKIASGENRITNTEQHSEWLKKISGSDNPRLIKEGRLLVIVGTQIGSKNKRLDIAEKEEALENINVRQDVEHRDITDMVLNIVSEITKYPKDMLELNMEMEADLGIDTVKQASIFARMMDNLKIPEEYIQQLSATKTIGSVIEFIRNTGLVKNSIEPAGGQKVIMGEVKNADRGSNTYKDKVKSEILRIFEEVTKYPESSLDLEMELESDLGIDTVKQATIFSKIFEKYKIPTGQEPQLSTSITIGKIVDFVLEQTSQISFGQNFEKLAELTQKVEEPQEDYDLSIPDVEREVIDIFSKTLGYPEEMLEADLELEADLDLSFEQSEQIFNHLENRLGLNKTYANFKTIGDVISWVKCPYVNKSDFENDGLSWQYPVLINKEFDGKPINFQDNHVWIIGDDFETVNKTAEKIKAKTLIRHVFEVSENEKALNDFVENPLDIIIDCTHILKPRDFNIESQKTIEDLLHKCGNARFLLYKKLLLSGLKHKIKIIVAISTDGGFGYSNTVNPKFIDPSFGAVSGFYKGLKKELPDADVKIVDFSKNYLEKPYEDLVGIISKELNIYDGDCEIGYMENKRFAVKIDELDRANFKKIEPNKDLHYLIAGGASGITSEITASLAKDPKNRITLVGRSIINDGTDNYDWIIDCDEEDIFKKIKEEMEGGGERTTPAKVRGRIEVIKKQNVIKRFLSRLKQEGANVQYYSCDVLDREKLSSTIEKATSTFGKVDVLINGTGYEKSAYLNKKTEEEFNQVFDTKVYGTSNLLDACAHSKLKTVILFSSIAGRFGNDAQIDYCAANAFLNLLARSYRISNPDCNVVSIDWSGWKDVGMAWRNEAVRYSSEEFGIDLIEPSRGVMAFNNILTRDYGTHEIIISKGLRNIFEENLFLSDMSNAPLLEWVTKLDGNIKRAHKIFTVKKDVLIDQHRMGVIPILPAAGSMELCSEFFVLMEGLKNGYCLRELSFSNPFKLFRSEPRELYVDGEKFGNYWDIKVKSELRPFNFDSVTTVVHAGMKVSELSSDYSDMYPDNWEWTKRTDMKEFRRSMCYEFSGNSSDEHMIKTGPLYYRLGEGELDICRECDQGIILPALFPLEQINNRKYPLENMVINPCFIDTLFQGGAISCGAIDFVYSLAKVYIPWSVEEVGVVRVPREDELFWVYCQRVSSSEKIITYNVSILDQHENIVCYARNASFKAV